MAITALLWWSFYHFERFCWLLRGHTTFWVFWQSFIDNSSANELTHLACSALKWGKLVTLTMASQSVWMKVCPLSVCVLEFVYKFLCYQISFRDIKFTLLRSSMPVLNTCYKKNSFYFNLRHLNWIPPSPPRMSLHERNPCWLTY